LHHFNTNLESGCLQAMPTTTMRSRALLRLALVAAAMLMAVLLANPATGE
tara:strand:- start:255 stop:404 length:150 start_codon:yes stop_codon:yes gene_type:complete